MKQWLCEFPLKATQQLLIEADTRAEAFEKLRRLYDGEDLEYEPLDVDYRRAGVGKVVREIKGPTCPTTKES